MKLMNHPILLITPLFILGIILGFQFLIPLKLTAICLCSIFLLFCGSYFYNQYHLFPTLFHTIITALSFVSLGFGIVQFQRIENITRHYIHYNLTEEVLVKGTISEKLKSTRYYSNYILKIENLQQREAEGKVLFSVEKDSIEPALEIGDELICKERLTDVYSPLNPYQFNYHAYLKNRKVVNHIKTDYNSVELLKENSSSLKKMATGFRQKIIQNLNNSGLSENQVALTSALLLGQKKELDTDIYDDFTSAGVVHILAVSGLHVGIILIILNFVLNPLEQVKGGKYFKYALSVSCIWLFALLVGFSPSVIRAATMFTFLNAGLIFNRKASTINMLCLSALVMLIYDPYFIFSVGFQMSYLAVLGIISFQPLLKRKFYIKNWLGRKLFDVLLVSFCAQVGVLPLSIFYFHQFPGLFLLANLLIIPWLFILLSFGIVVIIASFVHLDFPMLYEFYGRILDFLLFIIHQVASYENLIFRNIYFTKEMMFSLYSIILISFLFFRYKRKRLVFGLLMSVLVFQTIYIYDFYQIHQQEKLFVLHKNRKSIIIDKIGDHLKVFTNQYSALKKSRLLENFKTELASEIDTFQFKKFYQILTNKNLFVIDSLGIWQLPKEIHADYILLCNSPKINLEKVLQKVKPLQVIVDGSNYFSYVERWKNTCKKKKVPFHYTREKGAFIIDH